MNDQHDDRADLDLQASELFDSRMGGRPQEATNDPVAARAEQFAEVRRALRDDADAPPGRRLDELVANAMGVLQPGDRLGEVPPPKHRSASTRRKADAGPEARIVPLPQRSTRTARWLGAAAATIVVLAGVGWLAFANTDRPGETASIDFQTDPGAEAGSTEALDETTGPGTGGEADRSGGGAPAPTTTMAEPAAGEGSFDKEEAAEPGASTAPQIAHGEAGDADSAAPGTGAPELEPPDAPGAVTTEGGSVWSQLGQRIRAAVLLWWILG